MNKFQLTLALFIFVLPVSSQQNSDLFEEGYYFSKTLNGDFTRIVERVKQLLKDEKFGVVTELDMDKTMKEKLDIDMKPYKILGVCHPSYAYEAIKTEPNIGLMLPCKVLIREIERHKVLVAAINPGVVMKQIGNEGLDQVADKVSRHFRKVMESL